ncbi:tRNA methyltransferase 10 homolog B isoform X2 [Conger conger]|nr:tRNA methyltransferase 10 homolog B isoform X2 [Conger conger]XP_061108225.1 tRNA methyltransferase 10 homolog B isoform X2 [Conger conger]
MDTTETVGQEKDKPICTFHLNTTEETRISEMLDLLHIDLEIETKPAIRLEAEDCTCSRNVRRKRRNWERRLAANKDKRKDERLRRRLKRAEQPAPYPDMDSPQHSKRVVKVITRERLRDAQLTGPKLCVDCGLTECMSHKEISRLSCQIRRLYGSNRRAARPFHIVLTDLRESSLLFQECLRMNDGFLHYVMDVTEESCIDLFPLESLIYLTPDAEQALNTVDPEKVYILGGLVDESIQKKISFLKAKASGICTARLPIDEYMVKKTNPKNFHSKILAINQVFDILLCFCESGSWTQALGVGVPLGKGYVVAQETTETSATETKCGTGKAVDALPSRRVI